MSGYFLQGMAQGLQTGLSFSMEMRKIREARKEAEEARKRQEELMAQIMDWLNRPELNEELRGMTPQEQNIEFFKLHTLVGEVEKGVEFFSKAQHDLNLEDLKSYNRRLEEIQKAVLDLQATGVGVSAAFDGMMGLFGLEVSEADRQWLQQKEIMKHTPAGDVREGMGRAAWEQLDLGEIPAPPETPEEKHDLIRDIEAIRELGLPQNIESEMVLARAQKLAGLSPQEMMKLRLVIEEEGIEGVMRMYGAAEKPVTPGVEQIGYATSEEAFRAAEAGAPQGFYAKPPKRGADGMWREDGYVSRHDLWVEFDRVATGKGTFLMSPGFITTGQQTTVQAGRTLTDEEKSTIRGKAFEFFRGLPETYQGVFIDYMKSVYGIDMFPPAMEPEEPKAEEGRGFFGRAWDYVTGGFRPAPVEEEESPLDRLRREIFGP